MKSQLYFIIFLVITSIASNGCYDELDSLSESPGNEEECSQIIIGEELEDPYSLKNMRKAYSIIRSKGPGLPDIDLKPTHLYLKFLPENSLEADLLKNDTSLNLYDFPLNYEISSGLYYQDPLVPDHGTPHQYCVVKIDQPIPEVKFEKLYEVFIPPDEMQDKSEDLSNFFSRLEYESVKMTGNLSKEEIADSKGLLPSKWTPSGTIRVWDDILGYIPLQGVKVHARWFTHVETSLTDEKGFFETSRFRYAVNYSIKWERPYFAIRNGLFFQAWYNGPRKKGKWDLDISNGESLSYATIHRAAYKHYYGDNLGLNRPILPSPWKTKLSYINKYGSGSFLGNLDASGIFPEIRIWGKDKNGELRPTDRIFGIASHELGHQAHSLMMNNIRYWQVSKVIYESWAEAVEMLFTNDEYNTLGKKFINRRFNYYYPYSNHYRWPHVEDKDYSPIFIDLIDDINQRYSKGLEFPNDEVSGYSLRYINSKILRQSFGLKSLYNEVKENMVESVTENQIDELFKFYW
jgi:hypothetical protein